MREMVYYPKNAVVHFYKHVEGSRGKDITYAR